MGNVLAGDCLPEVGGEKCFLALDQDDTLVAMWKKGNVWGALACFDSPWVIHPNTVER